MMKSLVFVGVLLGAILVQTEVDAQGILYTAPGVDLSYGVGFDVGNGVQIGYGVGAGSLVTPQQLMTSVQGPVLEPIEAFCSGQSQSYYAYSWTPPVKAPVKKAKPVSKGHKTFAQGAKPMAQLKQAK